MSNISKKKLKEVIDFMFNNDEKTTLETFSLTSETLARYKRKYQKDIDKDQFKLKSSLKKIEQNYTEKELKAIADGGRIIPGHDKIPILDFSGESVKFAHITDTHIGSIFFKEDHFYKVLEECEKEKVDFYVHSGDVFEGMSNRAGHIYEIDKIGYAQQKEYGIELFSNIKKPVYMIDGNHDRWFIKSNGAEIVKDLCEHFDNFEFIGHDMGTISIKKSSIMLWHGLDGSCFDDQTEIMTDEGFIFFKDLTVSHKVATMAKENHIFEWQKPIHVFSQPYDGDMIHFKSRCVDSVVTPNHGMWTRASNAATYKRKRILTLPQKSHRKLNNNWHRKEAGDILKEYSRQKWQFTLCSEGYNHELDDKYIDIPYRESKNPGVKVHHFGKLKMEDVAELIAWYTTEGYAGEKGRITICQDKKYNPENHQQIIRLLKRIGVKKYKAYGLNEKDISFGSMEMRDYLIKECGHLSANKFLPKWLKNQNKDILRIVFDTMIKGDGWKNGRGYGYRSISNQLLTDLGEVAVKLGYMTTYRKGGDSVNISSIQKYPTVNQKPTISNYKGKVYCCEVPNSLIFVRRNGRCLWTHNSYATSYRVQKVVESLTGGSKPNILCAGHTHKQINMFERNIQCFSGGCIQMQTDFMRGKRLAAHPGFWIIKANINKKGQVSKITPSWYPFYM